MVVTFGNNKQQLMDDYLTHFQFLSIQLKVIDNLLLHYQVFFVSIVWYTEPFVRKYLPSMVLFECLVSKWFGYLTHFEFLSIQLKVLDNLLLHYQVFFVSIVWYTESFVRTYLPSMVLFECLVSKWFLLMTQKFSLLTECWSIIGYN